MSSMEVDGTGNEIGIGNGNGDGNEGRGEEGGAHMFLESHIC